MVQEVDHLTWLADASFECYGARIRLRCNTPEVWDGIARRLPLNSVAVPSSAADHVFSLWVIPDEELSEKRSPCVIYCGSSAIAYAADLDEALERLESAIHFGIATAATEVFVHAGVVGWQGHAIVIPGRSLSGKTTLVETLVRQGATYYSDEYAVLDAAGRVHPYVKSLSMRRPGQPNLRLRPSKVGRIGTQPLPLGTVVLTGYSRGVQWNPQRLSPADCMLALLDNTVMARDRPVQTMSTLRNAVSAASGIRSQRDNAEEAARWILAAPRISQEIQRA